MFKSYSDLADDVLAGTPLVETDALRILRSTDAELLELLAAAGRLRRTFFGTSVKANYLVNLKSGKCPEDCTYCSQRLGAPTEILRYSWLGTDEAVEQAGHGIRGGASRVCLVASGRGPSERDVTRVADMAAELKREHPGVEVCACLGILRDGQAERLRDAGVDAYNHNLNTAESMYEDICSTHSFEERVSTVEQAKSASLSPCSGLIVGMGETDEQLVEAVFALRALDADSIPVNFLMPFDGTPLEGTWHLTPNHCLRILALVRFASPESELRIAGGREMHLRSLQPLALQIANSLFLGDYLTSEGQGAKADLDMIADAGFQVLGLPDPPHASPEAACEGESFPEPAGGCCGSASNETPTATNAETEQLAPAAAQPPETSSTSRAMPAPNEPPAPSRSAMRELGPLRIRRRGAGTEMAPNA